MSIMQRRESIEKINSSSKFNPEDERIFCPNVSKAGVTGHGYLKKYYIPHLGINICEYCEIVEDGQKRNLSYYQSRKLSVHLISELQNYKEVIMKFQVVNKDLNVNSVNAKIEENTQMSRKTKENLGNLQKLIADFDGLFQNKINQYFKFLEEIMLIKDLISECKFDKDGKFCLIGIGIEPSKEAKYIWLSLIITHMKRENRNNQNFGLTEILEKLIFEFFKCYNSLNDETMIYFKNLCYSLLPEMAKLENIQGKPDQNIMNLVSSIERNHSKILKIK